MESLMMPLLGKHFQAENRLRIVKAHDFVVERLVAVRSHQQFFVLMHCAFAD